MRHDAQHFGQFGDIGAAAAEFRGNARLDQPGFLQKRLILSDETIRFVEMLGPFCKRRQKLADNGGRACDRNRSRAPAHRIC